MAMNIDLKNINVADIKNQLTKLLADKKMVTKIGIIVGAIVFFFNYLLCSFKSNG